ncbi:MAG: hypothetical protein K9N09_03140 [Candidatus Cloacimonetes bacterium]|nr:hypothetical protein [Candidatus Cloacimonadota bacterium]MCF7814537.1 hypothetical protein [Candidatus Cloacimonadota bacterium]MCF7867671.1 hypothetical protein [Candidatus Cloacimonadota bacterium]MCF7883531.1 hypothetical protein [Candidatus Cloacimonadota bacterium]
MKKFAIVSGFLAFGSSMFARSKYCLDNAPALAGSVVIGAILTFIIVLIFSKLLPKNNKVASCITNIVILILWVVASFFVCFLIRTFLY